MEQIEPDPGHPQHHQDACEQGQITPQAHQREKQAAARRGDAQNEQCQRPGGKAQPDSAGKRQAGKEFCHPQNLAVAEYHSYSIATKPCTVQ